MFPNVRPRRLRQTAAIRNLVREVRLDPGDFVLPLFFSETLTTAKPVGTMPGVDQLPVSAAAEIAQRAHEAGLGGVILFGLPKEKDACGDAACNPNGPVPQAVMRMKDKAPDLLVMTDTCVDEYTDHGHCGVLVKNRRGEQVVDNDATLEVLCRSALTQARAGVDVVAPSDMMDGRVGAIRRALDGEGFQDVAILSYAVKYASSFYGPFRDAADCAPKFGDRSSYQMDPGNTREALRELAQDEAEGADMVMVKPALPYLDVIARVRDRTNLPLAAYNVSGEYAMIKAAAKAGMLDEKRATLEALLSIKRAGADFILTYHALDAARWLG